VGTLNRKGQSALHLAGRAGFHEVLSWLSARAGKQIVELRDHHGNTARMYGQQALAAQSGGSPVQAEASEARVEASPVPPAPTVQAAALPSTSSLVEEPTSAATQEFKLFQEPEEFSISTSVNTPRARSRNNSESNSGNQSRRQSHTTAQAAALEAAAQVASAAVAAAAATAWADAPPLAHAEPLPAAPESVSGQDQPYKLDEFLDECW